MPAPVSVIIPTLNASHRLGPLLGTLGEAMTESIIREVILAVLRSLADNVSKDLQLAEQITTSQTEIRSQAVVAVILPFVVLVFLVASNDNYRSFYRTTAGWVVVSLGVAMAIAGWKLITALGRIPAEERVLVDRAVS